MDTAKLKEEALALRRETFCRLRQDECVVIKRESGEKPGQSRCCKRLIAASNMVTDIFSGRPLAMSFASFYGYIE